jgi:5-formyltetrahydrofolate cyclo-ligase
VEGNQEKAKVRAEISAVRIRPEEREEASLAIYDRIKSFEAWQDAQTVLLFSPLTDEPDVERLFDESKRVCFPRFKADRGYESAIIETIQDLVVGKFGIQEPPPEADEVNALDIDICLVPGLAFDEACNRLGRGRGFYDRWLPQISGIKIGIGFDHQLIKSVPTESHDHQLDMVVVPSRAIKQ